MGPWSHVSEGLSWGLDLLQWACTNQEFQSPVQDVFAFETQTQLHPSTALLHFPAVNPQYQQEDNTGYFDIHIFNYYNDRTTYWNIDIELQLQPLHFYQFLLVQWSRPFHVQHLPVDLLPPTSNHKTLKSLLGPVESVGQKGQEIMTFVIKIKKEVDKSSQPCPPLTGPLKLGLMTRACSRYGTHCPLKKSRLFISTPPL